MRALLTGKKVGTGERRGNWRGKSLACVLKKGCQAALAFSGAGEQKSELTLLRKIVGGNSGTPEAHEKFGKEGRFTNETPLGSKTKCVRRGGMKGGGGASGSRVGNGGQLHKFPSSGDTGRNEALRGRHVTGKGKDDISWTGGTTISVAAGFQER